MSRIGKEEKRLINSFSSTSRKINVRLAVVLSCLASITSYIRSFNSKLFLDTIKHDFQFEEVETTCERISEEMCMYINCYLKTGFMSEQLKDWLGFEASVGQDVILNELWYSNDVLLYDMSDEQVLIDMGFSEKFIEEWRLGPIKVMDYRRHIFSMK